MEGNSFLRSPSVFLCFSPLHIASCLWSSSGTRFRFQELVEDLITFASWPLRSLSQIHHVRSGILWCWLGTWKVLRWWLSFYGWGLEGGSGIRWSFMKPKEWIDGHQLRLSWVFSQDWSLSLKLVIFKAAVPFCCWVFLRECWFWHRELIHRDPHHQVISICLYLMDLQDVLRVNFPFGGFLGFFFEVPTAFRPVWGRRIIFLVQWWFFFGIR